MSASFGKRGLVLSPTASAGSLSWRRLASISPPSTVPVSLKAVIVASAGLLPLQLAYFLWDGTLLVENLWRPIQEHGADGALSMVPILCVLLFAALFNGAHFAALYGLPAHAVLAALGVTSYLGYVTATAVSGLIMEGLCRALNLFPVGHGWILPCLMGAVTGLLYRWTAGLRNTHSSMRGGPIREPQR